MISQHRAAEIKQKAQELAEYGPWADQLTKAMTSEEDAEVRMHWNALPSDSSYMDAFLNFLQGATGEMG
jgi:hypothetical protein